MKIVTSAGIRGGADCTEYSYCQSMQDIYPRPARDGFAVPSLIFP